MIVTCPRCLTKFNLPEEMSVSGAELNLHCSRCGWDFIFSPPPSDLEGVQELSEELLAPEVEELEEVDLENAAGEAADSDGFEDEVSLDEGGADAVVTTDVKDEAAPIDVSPADGEEADDFIDEVFDDSIFELAGDFDDDGVSLSNDAPATSEETSEPSEDGDGEFKVEELALDIDDLNLDDIEFDSFDDEPDSVSEINETPEETQNKRSTQLDDGGLDNLINQVDEPPKAAAVSTAKERSVKEPGQRAESLEESSISSPARGKSSKDTNKKRNFILALACFVALSLALWAGYGLWQRFSVDMVKHIKLTEVENRRLRLSSERTVIVMRGKVVNSSPKLVTDLNITGVLLDETGQAVAKVVTAGGVSFSEEELDRLDAGKLAMLENTSVTLAAHGGELPFMIAFYDYPEKVSECYVELTSFKVKKGRRP